MEIYGIKDNKKTLKKMNRTGYFINGKYTNSDRLRDLILLSGIIDFSILCRIQQYLSFHICYQPTTQDLAGIWCCCTIPLGFAIFKKNNIGTHRLKNTGCVCLCNTIPLSIRRDMDS